MPRAFSHTCWIISSLKAMASAPFARVMRLAPIAPNSPTGFPAPAQGQLPAAETGSPARAAAVPPRPALEPRPAAAPTQTHPVPPPAARAPPPRPLPAFALAIEEPPAGVGLRPVAEGILHRALGLRASGAPPALGLRERPVGLVDRRRRDRRCERACLRRSSAAFARSSCRPPRCVATILGHRSPPSFARRAVPACVQATARSG